MLHCVVRTGNEPEPGFIAPDYIFSFQRCPELIYGTGRTVYIVDTGFAKKHCLIQLTLYTIISGFGQTGPWKDRTAFDGVIQAASGIMSVNGEEGRGPMKVGISLADAVGGLFGCIGTLGALVGARETGVGRMVDVSMMDALLEIMETNVVRYASSGVILKQMGNFHATGAPFCPFRFKDGEHVYVTCATDNTFNKLCKMLGREDLPENPKFATFSKRSENRWEIEEIIQKILMDWDSKEFCREMEKNRLPFSPINNIKDAVECEQTAARNMIVTAKYPTGQVYRTPGNAIKVSDMKDETEYTASPLGYDTFEVLSQYADESMLHDIFDPILEQCEAAAEEKYAKSK